MASAMPFSLIGTLLLRQLAEVHDYIVDLELCEAHLQETMRVFLVVYATTDGLGQLRIRHACDGCSQIRHTLKCLNRIRCAGAVRSMATCASGAVYVCAALAGSDSITSEK